MKRILPVSIIVACWFSIFASVNPEIVFGQNWQYNDASEYQCQPRTNFYNNTYSSNSNPANNNSNGAKENILIILDSSESMEDKIQGEPKIEIAKRTINNVLAKVSPSINIGLRVYGHEGGLFAFNACRASELKVPIAPNTIGQILSVVNSMKPTGMTPITYSLEQAINMDLAGLKGPKRIILVSDGAETCDGSPCDYALELVRMGVDVKIDAVGFALDDPDAVNQLKCVALSTKAEFYSANNASELEKSLIRSLNVSTDVHGTILKK